MNRFFKKLFRNLPHSVVYHGYRTFRRQQFKTLQKLRTKKVNKNGYSLRGFDQNDCVFIHIPKTGGMSVSLSLFGNRGGGHRTYFSYYPIYSPEEFQRYFKFSFVRNPWDRLVSAYFFLKEGGLTDTDEKWYKQEIAEYHSFKEFVERWLTKQNIYSYLHFIPQHYYVAHRGQLMIDKVYKLENITSAINDINSKLNLDISLPHKNKTNSRKPEYHQYYDNKTKKIVERAYKKDIQLFGYTF